MRNRNHLLAALVALASTPALAAQPQSPAGGSGTITGHVDATPAKFLADTVVYLKEVPGHYAGVPTEVDQKGMQFTPRIVLLTVGAKVTFQNHDHVFHNVYSPGDKGYFLGTFPYGQSVDHVFDKPGVYTQLCSIHPEMVEYIFVGQNPYSAIVDKAGNFTLKDVPPGTYELAVWNVQLQGAPQKVTVAAGQTAKANVALHR